MMSKGIKNLVGLIVVLAGLLFLLGLSGCSGTGPGKQVVPPKQETNQQTTSQKEKYPDRPITFIVNYGPGGSADTLSRLFSSKLEKELGVSVIIKNVAGGQGTVGINELVRTKPDGYSVGLIATSAMAVAPIMQQVGFDPFKDVEYIAGFARYLEGVVSRANLPYKSIQDVVEAARAKPGQIIFGASAPGVAMALMVVAEKEKVSLSYVPQKSTGETTTALVGGNIDLGILQPGLIKEFESAGKIKLIAVASESRWPDWPTVPTLKEQGYDIDASGWFGVGAPVGVPKERLDVLYNAFKKVSEDIEIQEKLKNMDYTGPLITGEELKKNFRERANQWRPLLERMATTK